MQPSVKKGSLKKPSDLVTFPWEKPDTNAIGFIINNQQLLDEIFPKIIKNE